jgi:hypothetical protein
MTDTHSDIASHARTYHGFLMGLRWVVLSIAASLTTIVLILDGANIIAALLGGSVVFALFAYITRHIFLNPHEHEVEDMAGLPPPSR